MNSRTLVRAALRVLAALAVLAAFVLLDWLPTVGELGRLRRQLRDETIRRERFLAMTSGFVMPDAHEKSLFAASGAELRRSLPVMEDDDSWLAAARRQLQERAALRGISTLQVRDAADKAAAGRRPGTAVSAALDDWLSARQEKLSRAWRAAADPGRYPWHGVFAGLDLVRRRRLACRPLLVALAAPLPALLGFIGDLGQGAIPLEIACMVLEPAGTPARAWLICRGHYRVRRSSAWFLEAIENSDANGLPIDRDSPLLWQRVTPQSAYRMNEEKVPIIASWKGR
ncbi:MAG: hypothetical protein JXO51_04830 [Candidatus Aminicenantes bacterium]|nr:hypothetical protein [Candidatus Aminicenantes bacterium]